MGPRIVACSHHKSGASYTVKTFRALAESFAKKLWLSFYDIEEPGNDWDICVHQHSRIVALLADRDFVGWHCIRNPKALIYSAAMYHEKCAEPWVDVPLQHFSSATFWAASHGDTYNRIKDPTCSLQTKSDIMQNSLQTTTGPSHEYFDSGYDMAGATYRQFLQGLPTIKEKLLFEMKAYSRGVINDMLVFPRDERFFRIRLEEISSDPGMESLSLAMMHLGFTGGELAKALDVCKEHCLWNIGVSAIKRHATTGMSADWRSFFNGQLGDEFDTLFPGAEEHLGY